MASIQKRGKRYQLRVKHKLLDKPFFFTFDTESEAQAYGAQLDALLARGAVPAELRAGPAVRSDDPLLIEVIRGYSKDAPVTASDSELLDVIVREVAGLRVSGVTFAWCQAYVDRLKMQANLAPGTIRKRVGSLGRVVDCQHARLIEFGASVTRPACPLFRRARQCFYPPVWVLLNPLPTLTRHVSGVVATIAEKQVFWVYARRVVAAMQDTHAGWQRAFEELPCGTVGQGLLLLECESAIAQRMAWTCPFDATTSNWCHVLLESNQSVVASHRVVSSQDGAVFTHGSRGSFVSSS